jgi:ApaG protein
MYREVTDGIQIDVEPNYMPEQSKPEQKQFVFSYTVTISNIGTQPAQLLKRNWIITNGDGQMRQVDGPGVIGEQPRILPGEGFRYSSYCPLETPTGNMRGTYEMVDDLGRTFHVKIPLFFFRDLRNLH